MLQRYDLFHDSFDINVNLIEKPCQLGTWVAYSDAEAALAEKDARIAELEAMVESMKCCKTCRHCVDDSCAIYKSTQCFLNRYSAWEMKK